MTNKKLKLMFILCSVVLIILIIVACTDFEKIFNKNEMTNQNGIIVENTANFSDLNYNNLTDEEKVYISDLYSGNVKFTEKGVEVYTQSITPDYLNKIITTTYPEDGMGLLIPKPEYGTLDRIEYSDNWIEIYINDSSKNDTSKYLKTLKGYGFDKNQKKEDTNIMLKYEINNENGDLVTITYKKRTKELQIKANKMQNN